MNMSSMRILITAGPTHEPIDSVRFIGNRSSGRMGTALALEAAERGWHVTLLMGPAPVVPSDPRIALHHFRSCSDLQQLLRTHVAHADVLVMAAAVADYRPKVNPDFFGAGGGKFRRKSENLMLELEPTPDLLAEVSASRRADQLFVGFALEPREELLASARSKMERKKVDLVVGNPLETMDSDMVEAIVVSRDMGDGAGGVLRTPGKMTKREFAPWVLSVIEKHAAGLGRG
jgi:phosphopantothenoylcysteine decarboxylase / phosphopantothenate---cysteine ligase